MVLETRLILQDDELLFTPVTGPTQLLADLLKMYWQGCHLPLKLFDKSSYEYARVELAGKADKALLAAERAWSAAGGMQRGEEDDSYYRQLYREIPLDETFTELALRVYGPIQQHLQGGKL